MIVKVFAHIDAATQVVSNDIGTQGDPVAVTIENDRRARTFLDHVSGNNGTVGVFNDNTVAEMVVNIVAVEGQIESIETGKRIVVFLEVICIDDDVMVADEVNTGFSIVCQDAVCDARILKAEIEEDPVPSMMIDRDAMEKDLLNPLGENSMAAFLISADAKIVGLDSPQSGLFVFGVCVGTNVDGRMPFLVLVNNVRRRP